MSHSQGRTFFRVPSNTFMEFVVKRIRGWRWEKVALITHNKMWGRTFSPKGKKALLPSDLLRGCTMECIRWSRIAFPVLFFFFLFFFLPPPPWPFVRGVCRCSGGHNIPIFISWFYSDAKTRSQWTTPAPTALRAPHNACCSGSCILIHPHIGNHCLSHAEERQPFHSNPPALLPLKLSSHT